MEKAPIEIPFTFPGFEDVAAGIVKWPMSVVRIASENPDRLIDLADKILNAWRGYTDESAFIFAETEGFEPNYAITSDNALDIVQRETGLAFAKVLEHAGVYKRTAEGKEAFLQFLCSVQ